MLSNLTMTFNLREWQERDFLLIRKAERAVKVIQENAGKGSDRFAEARQKFIALAQQKSHSSLCAAIQTRIDVRAVTSLLIDSDEFRDAVKVDRNILDSLVKPAEVLSRLSLHQLISAFFIHFDTVAVVPSGLTDWCEFIKSQLAHFENGQNELGIFARSADALFSPYGPSRVVAFAKNADIDFDVALGRLALNGFNESRYLTLARYQYYLDTLKGISVGEDHPVLTELCKAEVVNSPYTPEKQLGHVILETLIDRSEGSLISAAWQGVILAIAGDPRVPKSSLNYQRWWALLGEKRIALMRGWLSRFDLKLFLEILEQSAKDGSVHDMERMFESRKTFMEGLLEQGLITDSRLILSKHAESYLARHFDKNELPEYARTSSQQTSMIYLNIAGRLHMIEGSHSFKLKLFDQLPTVPNLSREVTSIFDDRDFRAIMTTRYLREYGNRDGFVDLTHDIHLNWQYRAAQFLRTFGVSVDISKLISRERYREYKEKFGAM